MRPRRNALCHRLLPREAQICGRLVEARDFLGINRDAAALKIGIPTSTLSNYELCVTPLKADVALRICRNLIISEEWLATGKFKMTGAVARSHRLDEEDDALTKIFRRRCMDLLESPEAKKLPRAMLFSQAFEKHLAPVFEQRINKFFYSVAIPREAWEDHNPELGRDILKLLIEEYGVLLQNEAIRRNCSPAHAESVYIGFLLRMAMFGHMKIYYGQQHAVDVADFVDPRVFKEPQLAIEAFKNADELLTKETVPTFTAD